jgi:hypothetical protein
VVQSLFYILLLTPELDIVTGGEGLMTFRLGNALYPFILSNAFASVFSSKIHKLRITLRLNSSSASPHLPCPHTHPRFDVFRPATFAEVSQLISESRNSHCDLGLILSTPLKNVLLLFFFPPQLQPLIVLLLLGF